MKREHFSLNAAVDSDDSQLPTLELTYDGPTDPLVARLSTSDGDRRSADAVDVAFRLRDDPRGVLSISDRLTGEFVCEVAAETDRVTDVVSAAEDGDGRYRITLQVSDDDTWTVEKRTLLVYDEGDRLLRTCSLIPGSVEI